MDLSTKDKNIETLEAQNKHLCKAIIDADASALEELTCAELVYGHAIGLTEDQTTFIQNLTSKKFDFVSMNISDQTISIVEDIAIAKQTLAIETNNDGIPANMSIGVMLVWKNTSDQWKLLARQAYKL